MQQVPATPVIEGICTSAANTAFIGVHGGPIPAAAVAVGLLNPEQALPDVGIDMEQDRKRKENPLDNPEAADPLEQQARSDFFGHLGAEADPVVQQRLLDEPAAIAGKASSSSSSSSGELSTSSLPLSTSASVALARSRSFLTDSFFTLSFCSLLGFNSMFVSM